MRDMTEIEQLLIDFAEFVYNIEYYSPKRAYQEC